MEPYPAPQDEGYSEDPLTIRSLGGNGYNSLVEAEMAEWLSKMPLEDRARLAVNIMRGLPTTTVFGIVESLRPRLFINFFDRLPPEVCLKVLGYLDAVSLINTAQASRDWYALSMDWKLWEHLYYKEGWHLDAVAVADFQAELSARQNPPSRGRLNGDEGHEHASKKRLTPNLMATTLSETEDAEMSDAPFSEQSSVPHASLFGRTAAVASGKPGRSISGDKSSNAAAKTLGKARELADTQHQYPPPLRLSYSSRLSEASAGSTGPADLSNLSSLVIRDRTSNRQNLNWQYLYTQRRRLEANWEQEKYINFQIPPPNCMHQAHTECIYTIQHSGKYLVSGSRDRSLRIWDLETRRLVRQPLLGHNGSVLCLQFDADPDQDLIVSGSSDSSVIIWRFSTGEIIQTLSNAHRESVLNVRFDHRILVTCSKDKTIKIFNRHALHPGQSGYPYSPQCVSAVPTILNNYGFSPSPYADLPIKPPFSMIGCLEGHGAAVNAVQIYNDEIVSASGDRNVKVWDWPLQTCTRTLIGHQKGIACVQYDGRRIVSGSSDNEVKVFDKATGLEVASLRAHTNLVRTVQAGFGDLPYSAEEDLAAARTVDEEYFKAVDSGSVPRIVHLNRGRPRNAGSRKPEDIMAYGAKLPPGGGGGKYGRIVSGSYDETIVIWRRDKEGAWKPKHTLRQEDAALAAAREFEARHLRGSQTAHEPSEATPDAIPVLPTHQAFFYHSIINQSVPQGPEALRQALRAYPILAQYPYLATAIASEPSPISRNALRNVLNQVQQAQALALHQTQLHAQQAGQPAPPSLSSAIPSTAAAATTPSATPTPGSAALSQPTLNAPAVAEAAAAAAAAADLPGPVGPALHLHPHLNPASMARVFKLQFDARRIICCSQTPIIVGWDFANGDDKIIEASRFFAPVE
ncbi:MAG: hypothetical protein M1818_008054 [Claussenomyces sp. TS43310]|nr:MAG: hypothetical protein M1818_008054 [Claussenomyces sp. TS43310]